jgi:hypothetical protein
MMLLLMASYAVAQDANTTQNAVAQDANTTQNLLSTRDSLMIECCTMYKVLTSFMVPSTGDHVNNDVCMSKKCLSLRLVQLFVNHSRSMLESQHIESVRTTETHIEIVPSVFLEKAQEVLVFAFLGRAVATEDGLRSEHMSLAYNSVTDALSIRDSSCAIDKTIYSTIVVASIALLVFFIATQVVETEKRKSLEAPSTVFTNTPIAVGADNSGAHKSFLRMRVHL